MGCETTSNVSSVSGVPTRQILLVDDDEALLDILPRTIELRVLQVAVTACDSVDVAFSRLQADRYELVITDLNMPRANGLTLVRRIKATFPDMAVMVITGHGDEEAENQALHAGVDGFIRKPFDRIELTAAI